MKCFRVAHVLQVCLTIVLLFELPGHAQEPGLAHKRFTNNDVVSMVQMGLSEEVITAKIRAMNAADPGSLRFDTSVEALQALKAASVPDGVMRVMINPAPSATLIAQGAAPLTLDPNLPPPEVGVYWRDESRFLFIDG